MDLVYLCRAGENEELRYSLRSVAANLPHDRVWIFGEPPAWVTGCEVVLIDQSASKFDNCEASLRAVLDHPEVSDPFVLMNDDFFVMREVWGIEPLSLGTVTAVLEQYAGRGIKGSNYLERMARTRATLRLLGFDEPMSYEAHVPMLFEKSKLRTILDEFGAASGVVGAHYRTLYGNLYCIGGRVIEDVKVYDYDKPVPQGDFASSLDTKFYAIYPVLRYLFPDAGPYELGEAPVLDRGKVERSTEHLVRHEAGRGDAYTPRTVGIGVR